MDLDVDGVTQAVSTGAVPGPTHADAMLVRAFERATGHGEGAVADYIPALAEADPDAFGLCIADVRGGLHELGDSRTAFSVQSVSKVYVPALLCDRIGHERVLEAVGANNTGLAFKPHVTLSVTGVRGGA